MDEMAVYQVVVSDKARDMLFTHASFLAQVSVKAGDALFDEFEKIVSSLEAMPERCALYFNPYIQPGKYRRIALGKYLLVLFQIIGNKVHIELVIDARAENKNLSDTMDSINADN